MTKTLAQVLDIEEVTERHSALVSKITEWEEIYRQKDFFVATDDEFDLWFSALKDLEDQYPHLSTGSPTQTIASEVEVSREKTYQHKQKLLSLDKVQPEDKASNEASNKASNDAKWQPFAQWLQALVPDIQTVTSEHKIDGLALCLIYREGKLAVAATRGNGVRGEDITANARNILGVPSELPHPFNIGEVEVRGEVYMARDDFERINSELRADDGRIYMNPRNAASATMRQLDAELVSQRRLRFIGYHLTGDWGYGSTSYRLLNKLGFDTVPIRIHYRHTVLGFDSCLQHYLDTIDERENLPYEVDGLVIKVDNIISRGRLGQTPRHPKWAVAWKLPAHEQQTKLVDVSFQVGRTGAITPLAHLEPVEIGGVVVERASVHNFAMVQSLDLHIDDQVIVRRAGDVIPQIMAVRKDLRDAESKPVALPKTCPCALKLPIEQATSLATDGSTKAMKVHKCTGKRRCPERLVYTLVFAVARNSLDIEGLSEQQIRRFISLGLIENLADVFTLERHAETLRDLERMGEKSVTNLLRSIETARGRVTPERLLIALGIELLGEVRAATLINNARSIDSISTATTEQLGQWLELSATANEGSPILNSVYGWFSDAENKDLLQQLRIELPAAFVQIQQKTADQQPLAGMVVALTGKLNSYNRNQCKKVLIEKGAKVTASVSSNTDFLIAGEAAGVKLTKAEKLSIPVFAESDLELMFNDTVAWRDLHFSDV